MRQNISGANRHIYITPRTFVDFEDVLQVLESIECELFQPDNTADYESVYFPVYSCLPAPILQEVLTGISDWNVAIYISHPFIDESVTERT